MQDLNSPLISVVIPVYNGEKYIEEALLSLQNQTWSNLEIIIVDDGSTDNSVSIVNTLMQHDQRISLIRLDHSGIVNALNTGIDCAKGDYIARMDADDICHPKRFEKQISFIEKNNLDLCGCNIELFDAGEGIKNFPITHDELVTNLLTYGKSIPHPTVIAKVCVFKKFTYSANYPNAEDYALWLDIILNSDFKLGNCPEVLLKYRVHEKQVSKEKKQSQLESTAKALIYHLGSACENFTREELIIHTRMAKQKEKVDQLSYDLHLSFMKKLKYFLDSKKIDLRHFDNAIFRICKRSIAFKEFPLNQYISLLEYDLKFFDRISLKIKSHFATS